MEYEFSGGKIPFYTGIIYVFDKVCIKIKF